MSVAAAEKTSHTVTWDPPSDPAKYAGLTGLEALQRSLSEGRAKTPITALMDFELISAEAGAVVIEGRPGVQHLNPIGIVHGGFAATVMDSAMWSAAQTTAEPGASATTLELKVNYARPITTRTGPVRCEAKVVHRGGRTAITEARIVDAEGKLYAHATSTLMILKA